MIIQGIEFNIIVNKKKIKRTYLKVRYIDNQLYLIIDSYKKMNNKEIESLVNQYESRIIKIANKIISDNESSKEFTLLGEVISKNEVTDKMIEEAYNKIVELFQKYKKVFNKPNTILKFKKMKTRWGVCYLKKDTISLTTPLIQVPLYITEYIIIHEFCHFKYPNHSKDFYNYVSQYCPDYKKRVKDLKNFSYILK